MRKERVERTATYGEALIVILFMFIVVTGGYVVFSLKVELLMIIAAVFAAIVAYKIGISWENLEKSISNKLSVSMPAIMIIWSIGIVIGTFMFCGSIPMIIYYGLIMINPEYLYLFAFLTCCVLSLVTGTSWGSAGTAGVALMSVAIGLGVSLPITAGAVISGAVFGDKMSPLSDTTNLAPLCAGATLYDHIRSMCWTITPTMVICCILYWILGVKEHTGATELPTEATAMINSLDSLYQWNWILLLPFLIIVVGACLKKPPVPTMVISAFAALAIGVVYQGFSIQNGFVAAIDGFKVAQITAADVSAGIITLLNRGGMKSMVGIVVMIFAGYSFAGIISRGNFLEIVLEPFLKKINSNGKLVFATLVTSFLVLCCSGITYVAFIVCGDMYKKKFYERNLQPRVLSRIMEDAATCMAPLVPWGTSGLYYASVLGVGVYSVAGSFGYAPYAFLTFVCPIISLIYGFTGIAMFKMNNEEREAFAEKLESEKTGLNK